MKKFMNKIRKNNKGFTLVELIIVVAIIAVLSAVLVPQYIQYVEKSRIGADESFISEVGHNLEIIAATDPTVNGSNITVEVSNAGINVDGATLPEGADPDDEPDAIAVAVQEELDALFPDDENKLVSNHYKGETVTITYTAASGSTPASLDYSDNCKNLT